MGKINEALDAARERKASAGLHQKPGDSRSDADARAVYERLFGELGVDDVEELREVSAHMGHAAAAMHQLGASAEQIATTVWQDAFLVGLVMASARDRG